MSERQWPDLVGKTGEEAKRIIEEEDSSLEVVILPETTIITLDYRLDRVRIFVKDDGTVASVPTTG